MFKTFFTIGLRNLWKQKGYSAINLLGMTVGLACCFLILIYIRHERSYDQFHRDVDRLFRINYQAKFSGSTFELTQVPAPFGPQLAEDFPQIEAVARLFGRSISVRESKSDRVIELPRGIFADSTVLQVFDFEFVEGTPKNALAQPYSIMLTDETARQFFGDKPALGKSLLLAGQTTPFTVTAVVRDFPETAHLHFDFLAPFSNIVDLEPPSAREVILNAQTNNWLASYTYTYVRLKPGASHAEVNAGIPAFLKRYGHPDFISKQGFVLFPVRDIHLRSEAVNEPESAANPVYLRMFAIVGILILLIACINFINLSNAIYLERMKEVAVRKVLGAGKRGLVGQFVGETMLLCALAFVLALFAVHLVLPFLDTLTDRELSYRMLADWPLTAGFAGLFLVAGLLAGIYPAFLASRFQPVQIFQKHTGHTGGGRYWLRKSLITVQFIVGIALLSGALIIVSQLNYWQNRPLGFDQKQVLTVPLFSANINSAFMPGDAQMRERTNSFEERLLQNPAIQSVTLASNMPGGGATRHPIVTDKISLEDNIVLPCMAVDYDFASTFGLKIVAGRDFGKQYGTDHIDGYLINETAVKTLGWDNPQDALGQKITKGGKPGKIVGVVNDFHTASLQTALDPVVLDIGVGAFTTFGIRLNAGGVPETLQFIENTWKNYFPEKAFEYAFLDENLQSAYQDERRLANLTGYFSAIAIFLSCFGLFGLISFTIHQRAKEIGIRKVLGATVAGIVSLVSRDYLNLILLAMLVATPLTWYFMNSWLDEFIYRIDMPWWVFVAAGLAVVVVAFLTLSLQSIKAAMANPVDSLRSE